MCVNNIFLGAKSVESACHLVSSALKDNNADILFALIYLLEDKDDNKSGKSDKTKIVRLVATTFDENLSKKKGDDGVEELSFDNGHSKRNLPDFLSETLKTQEFDEIDIYNESDNSMTVMNNSYKPINENTEIS